MDQQQGEAVTSDALGKVGETFGDLAGSSQKAVQDKIDQAKPVLRDLQESAGAVMDRAADLAQKASSAGALAVDAVQGAARDVANQASQAAATVYQQGARAHIRPKQNRKDPVCFGLAPHPQSRLFP